MFTKDMVTKIQVANNTYNKLIDSGISNALARKSAESIIKEALAECDDQYLLEYTLRIFFSNYKILNALMNSELCNIATVKACSKCTNASVADVKKVLLLKFDDDKIIFQWLIGNNLTRQAIEKHNSNPTILEAIRLFNKAGVNYSKYLNKYDDPLTLKRVAIILNRDTTFDTDMYDRYQIATIANSATSRELLEALNPKFLPDTICIVCNLMKRRWSKKEVLAVVAKYDDPKIVSNYFAVKEILNTPRSKRDKSIEIAKVINNTFISVVAKCPIDKDVPQYIMNWYLDHNTKADVVDSLEKAIDKVSTWFPFMPGIVQQLKDLYPKLSDMHDFMLDERSRLKEERRKNEAEQRHKEMLSRELPIAKVAIESYIMACQEDKMLSAKQFCANTDMDNALFTKYVNLIKDVNDPLYEKYHAISVANQTRAMMAMKSAAQEVSKALVEKKGKFTLYDYYTVTRFDMATIHNTMVKNPNVFTYTELLRFRNFWEKNRYETPMKISWFYNDYIQINGRELTTQDKDKILKFMNRMRYPLLIPIYKEIVRKYMAGTLEIY